MAIEKAVQRQTLKNFTLNFGPQHPAAFFGKSPIPLIFGRRLELSSDVANDEYWPLLPVERC